MRFGGRVGSRMNTLFFQNVDVSKSGKGAQASEQAARKKGYVLIPTFL